MYRTAPKGVSGVDFSKTLFKGSNYTGFLAPCSAEEQLKKEMSVLSKQIEALMKAKKPDEAAEMKAQAAAIKKTQDAVRGGGQRCHCASPGTLLRREHHPAAVFASRGCRLMAVRNGPSSRPS